MSVGAVDIETLGISLDRQADVPIGVQLAWALRSRISSGVLVAGQRLPGLRDLSDLLGVNVNTIRAVYQRLEHDGLIVTQQGNGTFVRDSLPARPGVTDIAARAAQAARETGLDPREVAAALYEASSAEVESPDLPAARRRRLRDQITALEQALSELHARHPQLASAPGDAGEAGQPRLLSVDELEAQRSELVRKLADTQVALDRGSLDPPTAPASGRAAKGAKAAKAHATPGKAAKRRSRVAPAGT